MDTKVFAAELARSLARRGVEKNSAIKHAVSLVRTFDEDDLKEIASYTCAEDFAELSDRLSDFIKEKEGEVPPEDIVTVDEDEDMKIVPRVPKKKAIDPMLASTVAIPAVGDEQKTEPVADNTKTRAFDIPSAQSADTVADNAKTRAFDIPPAQSADNVADNMKTRAFEISASQEIGADTDDMKTKAFPAAVAEDGMQTRAFTGINTSDIPKTDITEGDTCVNIPVFHKTEDTELGFDEDEVYLADDEDIIEQEHKVELTPRGKKYFISISIAASPFILIAAALVLVFFGFGIAAVCALIVLSLGLVCLEAVVGSVVCVVGIVYGAIQMVGGSMGVGLYEMGLGIAIGGLCMALGILTYSLATIVLPYGLKRLLSFEGYCFRRIGPMLNRFREECNRL